MLALPAIFQKTKGSPTLELSFSILAFQSLKIFCSLSYILYYERITKEISETADRKKLSLSDSVIHLLVHNNLKRQEL